MTTSSFEALGVRFELSSVEEIANISATNKKSKDTLISQTLKVEEKKVTLVFLICGPGAEIWPLYLFACISL